MTNYEKIKGMSVEEMAAKIHHKCCTPICPLVYSCEKGDDCIALLIEWLESEVDKNERL